MILYTTWLTHMLRATINEKESANIYQRVLNARWKPTRLQKPEFNFTNDLFIAFSTHMIYYGQNHNVIAQTVHSKRLYRE